MQQYDTFLQFWNELSTQPVNSYGFHDWQVVQILHTSDRTYASQRRTGQDELGFQPLSVTLANAFTHQTRRVLIKNVDDNTANDFRTYARYQYGDDLAHRFGSFRPDVFEAFTEYETWDEFYTTWLERAGEPVFGQNMPVLFDHTPKIEYLTRKQTGRSVLPYQRLLVTTYFAGKNQFFDFFIKNVDDHEMVRISNLLQHRIELHLDMMFPSPAEVQHA